MAFMFRKVAQTNAAVGGSPRRQNGKYTDAGTCTPPRTSMVTLPNGHTSPFTSHPSSMTPRTRMMLRQNSPCDRTSLSESHEFDWDAAKLHKPPPYGSPMEGARARAARKSEAGLKAAQRRIVKKPNWFKKMMAMPGNLMDEIAMFPDNIPMPEPKTSAMLIGGSLHLLNLIVRISQSRKVVADDWADLYNEHTGASWFDWTTPLTLILIGSAFFVAFRLFSKIRIYNFHHKIQKLNSPHAAFVDAHLDFDPPEVSSVWYRILMSLARSFTTSWRFVLNWKAKKQSACDSTKVAKVQQLSVWEPGEMEMRLFTIYSPAHAFLWMATTGSNWIVMFTIMGIVGLQSHLMTTSYEGLLKDKAIISAEVMHEYDEKFVNPRLKVIKKDKSVMTHQAEVVDLWG